MMFIETNINPMWMFSIISCVTWLNSDFDGAFNFQLGLFYQDIEQGFDAYQYAFNLPIMPNIFGPALALFGDFDPTSAIVGPDPATGNAYDYNKNHFLDTTVYSAMFAL